MTTREFLKYQLLNQDQLIFVLSSTDLGCVECAAAAAAGHRRAALPRSFETDYSELQLVFLCGGARWGHGIYR